MRCTLKLGSSRGSRCLAYALCRRSKYAQLRRGMLRPGQVTVRLFATFILTCMVPLGLQHGTEISEKPGVDGRWRKPYPRSIFRPCVSNCHTCSMRRGQPCVPFVLHKRGSIRAASGTTFNSHEQQQLVNGMADGLQPTRHC